MKISKKKKIDHVDTAVGDVLKKFDTIPDVLEGDGVKNKVILEIVGIGLRDYGRMRLELNGNVVGQITILSGYVIAVVRFLRMMRIAVFKDSHSLKHELISFEDSMRYWEKRKGSQ